VFFRRGQQASYLGTDYNGGQVPDLGGRRFQAWDSLMGSVQNGIRKSERRLNMKKDRKTISIKLRFATEDLIAKNEKGKRYKTCWDSGFAYIEANKTLGIKSNSADIFHNLEDIVPIIKKILRKQKIVIVSDNKKSRIV